MKPNFWIFPLEKIDSRYTAQWYYNIPEMMQKYGGDKFNITSIGGQQKSTTATSGAFLEFADTNRWKSSQLLAFLDIFQNGETTPDDRFLFTDFWNPTILQVKYMRDLLKQNWKIYGIAHAGAYDPTDILGLQMEKPWPWMAEAAYFHACDATFFASNFHRRLFLNNLKVKTEFKSRAIRSGQPHEFIMSSMEQFYGSPKQNLIMWPHRYNSDKQPEIVEDLNDTVYNKSIIITQKLNLDKDAYYKKMAECKVMFSCSLHENLGISMMEGVLAGVLPCVPDRASYHEMYLDCFKYPSVWTKNWDMYLKHKHQLADFIDDLINNYDDYQLALEKQRVMLEEKYLTGDIMFKHVLA